MVTVPLEARKPVERARLLALFDAFRTIEKPFLMHCKSGADRAGLASALYRMVIMGDGVEAARKHLGVRYVHLKWSKTGICDHLLDVYAARAAQSPIGIEEWITTEYDAEDLAVSFAHKRGQTR